MIREKNLLYLRLIKAINYLSNCGFIVYVTNNFSSNISYIFHWKERGVAQSLKNKTVWRRHGHVCTWNVKK